jgi:hypothetical protein
MQLHLKSLFKLKLLDSWAHGPTHRIGDASLNGSFARLPGESSLHGCRPVTNTGNIAFSIDSQHSGRTLTKHLIVSSFLAGHPAIHKVLPEDQGSPGFRETMTCTISCQSIENAGVGSDSSAGFLAPLLTRRVAFVARFRRVVATACAMAYSEAWLNLKSLGGKTPAGKHELDGSRICMQGRICHWNQHNVNIVYWPSASCNIFASSVDGTFIWMKSFHITG